MSEQLTPLGVLIKALDGDKTAAEKCLMALLDYGLDLEFGNNQEPVIRLMCGDWAIIDLWEDDRSLM